METENTLMKRRGRPKGSKGKKGKHHKNMAMLDAITRKDDEPIQEDVVSKTRIRTIFKKTIKDKTGFEHSITTDDKTLYQQFIETYKNKGDANGKDSKEDGSEVEQEGTAERDEAV